MAKAKEPNSPAGKWRTPNGAGLVSMFRPWRLYLSATLVGVGVIVISVLVDALFHDSERSVLLSDALAALVAGALTYRVLRDYALRQRVTAQRLAIVLDVNHHVRNALTAVLYSVHLRNDAQLMRTTEEAVARVDWVLKNILSDFVPGEGKQPECGH